MGLRSRFVTKGTDMTADGPEGLNLGQRLYRWRTSEKDWSQYDAARHFGVSQPNYGKWESGEHYPEDGEDGNLGAVAKALGISYAAAFRLKYRQELDTTDSDSVRLELLETRLEEMSAWAAAIAELVDSLIATLGVKVVLPELPESTGPTPLSAARAVRRPVPASQ